MIDPARTCDGQPVGRSFDKELISRFHLLGESNPAAVCTPPILIAFDVLQVGRRDLHVLPLARRRAVLEDQLGAVDLMLPARRLEGTGSDAWATVQARGHEGFVAKDPTSSYHEGPSGAWIKVKVRREGAFVVGGVAVRDGGFAGALVGLREDWTCPGLAGPQDDDRVGLSREEEQEHHHGEHEGHRPRHRRGTGTWSLRLSRRGARGLYPLAEVDSTAPAGHVRVSASRSPQSLQVRTPCR